MNRFFSLLLLSVTLSLSAWADAIVSGSDHIQCSTEVTEETPLEESHEANPNAVPSQCADLSGTWDGGCFYGVIYPNLPEKNGVGVLVPLTPNSNITPVPMPSTNLLGEPEYKETVVVRQSKCDTIQFAQIINGAEKDLGTIDFSKTKVYKNQTTIVRECKNNKGSFRRTHKFAFAQHNTPFWSANGSGFRHHMSNSALDSNYGATSKQQKNYDFYLWNGMLRLDAVGYSRVQGMDPGTNFSPANLGGYICTYRKK